MVAVSVNNEFYMNLAIKKAWEYQFLTYPNPAVGCVIVDKNGQILSIEAHEQAGQAHAELQAVIAALKKFEPNLVVPNEANLAYEFVCKHHKTLFKEAVAFVSLEPCAHFGKTPPCAKLLSELGFKKVFISVQDTSELAAGGAEFLQKNGVLVEFGVCEKEGLNLLKPFLKWRKNGRFKLFKLALSLNGSACGQVISCKESRIYAHKIRSTIDLLVIGGESVRKDRPTLDARLVNGKAPDICILSKHPLNKFDKSIPLFSVPNRQIYSQIPQRAKLIMYEGGNTFLQAFKDEMDAFLIFNNAKFECDENVKLHAHFNPLFRGIIGEDSYGIYEL